MTTETLHDKALRLAKEADLLYWWRYGDEDYALFTRLLTNLVRLAQKEALEDAANMLEDCSVFDHWLEPAKAVRKMKEELK